MRSFNFLHAEYQPVGISEYVYEVLNWYTSTGGVPIPDSTLANLKTALLGNLDKLLTQV